MDKLNGTPESPKLKRRLFPIAVWALSFGCSVGWGAFVMPGTTFLPIGGPLGTVIGIAIGALIMFIIGVNYSYLMKRYPDSGGTYSYTKHVFGYDHGLLSAWFLGLVYLAIIIAIVTQTASATSGVMLSLPKSRWSTSMIFAKHTIESTTPQSTAVRISFQITAGRSRKDSSSSGSARMTVTDACEPELPPVSISSGIKAVSIGKKVRALSKPVMIHPVKVAEIISSSSHGMRWRKRSKQEDRR